MGKNECFCCDPDADLRDRMIEGFEYDEKVKKPWVFVPREPANFGHLIVVSGKHYKDISDEGLVDDTEHLRQIVELITRLASRMKKYLTYDKKKCEKVYVSTLCETDKFHIHFHLIPRFEEDEKGFTFLFDKELEEARWTWRENEKEEDKIHYGYLQIGTAMGILGFHKHLLQSKKWARPNEEREGFIRKIKGEIDGILKKEPMV